MLIRTLIRSFLLFLILIPQLSPAQIASEGLPYSLDNPLPENLKSFTVKQSDLARERLKITSMPGLKPFLFAIPIDTSISVIEEGQRDKALDGTDIYRLKIMSKGAYSINITFNKYKLPPGAKLFIYTPDYEVIRGAYTDLNNKSSGRLATTPLPGEELVIELNIPPGGVFFEPGLSVGRIAHDFMDPFGFKSGFGSSGDCNVDINCPEGADWQIEKKSVMKFIRGGVWLCSGALINNTANDGRPLLYTANHCIATQRHAETSVFYFNYESATCNGPNGRLDHSISGSDLLATTSKLDFGLVELSIVPPPAYEPYYAGWNRVPSSSTENVTCIHHPSGDVKKISKRYGKVVTGDFGSGFDANTHWHISQWDLGTTEGGSSGSPLFDADHKIIGDLTGGDASCTYNYNDYFQKFFVCWDRYPEPESQLKYWLDPLGEDVLVWNGFDPNASGKIVANIDFSPVFPFVGKKVRFKDISEGQPTSWEWVFENGVPATSTEQNPVVRFTVSGKSRVKLYASNEFGTDSVQQTISVTDYRAFIADQNRIVNGDRVKYSDISTGEPLSHQWTFEGGEPGSWTGPDPADIQYNNPGTYDATLLIEYQEFTDTLHYRDFIKVEPESLLFAGTGLKSLNSEDAIQNYNLGSQGWIAGNNSIGIDAFANKLIASPDTLMVATGIRIPIGMLPGSVTGTYLTAVLWDSVFSKIISDSIELNNEPFPDYQTIWFRHPVGIDSLVYAGFVVPVNQTGTFCTKIATPKSLAEKGSAFARRNGRWMSLYEAAGIISDLGIVLETSYLFNDFNSQIKISSRITDSKVFFDLSQLVYDNFDVQVYDMLGRQIISSYYLYDKTLELEFLVPVSGMYLFRFSLDNLSFTKKILLVKTR